MMIVILDFGSQYTQLIARRIRSLGVYCEIFPYDASPQELRAKNPKGIIFSGGPSSLANGFAPQCAPDLFLMGVPILGVCYGHQLLARMLGGKVRKANKREYGLAKLTLESSAGIFDGLAFEQIVWMSHADEVEELPHGFVRLGSTDNSRYSAVAHPVKKLYGLQFHPEVHHTPQGHKILENFVFGICKAAPSWTMPHFVETQCEEIRKKVGAQKVLCALSGGVDSSVTAALLERAIGDQLTCVFVDNGLLRHGELERVRRVFGKRVSRLEILEVQELFFQSLQGVTDPEEKRRRIGSLFIEVFEKWASPREPVPYLAQGTLYPDVIESRSVLGPSSVIKTHHNVGGLPKNMKFELIEPLSALFKDEVRKLGAELGLPEEILSRHPFPGPGFAVRILGEVTPERVELLRRADRMVEEETRRAGLYQKLWQIFAVLVPVKTVGVVGDERAYGELIAIRAVESIDAMTADWAKLAPDFLSQLSNRILNEVAGINRVVYDISSKPPATIEWE